MSTANNAKPLPKIFIYKEVVNERVKNYVNNKLPLLSQAIGKQDSNSGWYSLDQFEDLMREMYYLNADGVRIYFGAYGSDDSLYPGQLTVMFVPTYFNKETGHHTDIIIEDIDGFEGRSIAETNFTANSKTTKNYDSLGLCPPDCGFQTLSYPY